MAALCWLMTPINCISRIWYGIIKSRRVALTPNVES
jgi:hypothetical protein